MIIMTIIIIILEKNIETKKLLIYQKIPHLITYNLTFISLKLVPYIKRYEDPKIEIFKFCLSTSI